MQIRRLTRYAATAAALLVTTTAGCGDDPIGMPDVHSVELQVPDVPLSVGATYTVHAVARDARGREISGRQVQWMLTNPLVATLGSALGEWVEVSGLARGEAHLTATVDGVSNGATVTVRRLCDFGEAARTSLAYGSSIAGSLGTGDCETTLGDLYDLYIVSVPTQRAVELELTSTSFIPSFTLAASGGVTLATYTAPAGSGSVRTTLNLQQRSYFIRVAGQGAGAAGAYQLTVKDAP